MSSEKHASDSGSGSDKTLALVPNLRSNGRALRIAGIFTVLGAAIAIIAILVATGMNRSRQITVAKAKALEAKKIEVKDPAPAPAQPPVVVIPPAVVPSPKKEVSEESPARVVAALRDMIARGVIIRRAFRHKELHEELTSVADGMALQRALNLAVVTSKPLEVDGHPAKLTMRSLAKFQAEHNLPVLAEAGQRTFAALIVEIEGDAKRAPEVLKSLTTPRQRGSTLKPRKHGMRLLPRLPIEQTGTEKLREATPRAFPTIGAAESPNRVVRRIASQIVACCDVYHALDSYQLFCQSEEKKSDRFDRERLPTRNRSVCRLAQFDTGSSEHRFSGNARATTAARFFSREFHESLRLFVATYARSRWDARTAAKAIDSLKANHLFSRAAT